MATSGYTVPGGSYNVTLANQPSGDLITLSGAATASSVSVYARASTAAGNVKCCIYTNAAGTPGTLVATGSATTLTTTAGWVTMALSGTISAGTYWLLVVPSVESLIFYNLSTGGTAGYANTAYSGFYSSPPATYSTGSATWTGGVSGSFSLYLTYSAAGTSLDAGSAIAAGTPTIGTPTIGQRHALSGYSISAGTPTIGTPTIGQVHAMTGASIDAGTPAIGTPAIGQRHALSGYSISAGTPTIDTPTISSTGGLIGANIDAGTPVIETPSLGQFHVLSGANITAGFPAIGIPGLSQLHVLAGYSIFSGTPSIGTPTIGQVHILSAQDISASTPVIGTPSISLMAGHFLTLTDVRVTKVQNAILSVSPVMDISSDIEKIMTAKITIQRG